MSAQERFSGKSHESGGQTAAQRPAPWALPPDGYHFEAVEEHPLEMRLATDEEIAAKRCRHSTRDHCPHPVAAAIRRGNYRPQWWCYCAEHLYGRWIEDGRIFHWRLVRDGR